MIALDCAAAEFYENGVSMITQNLRAIKRVKRTFFSKNKPNTWRTSLAEKYPIISIEDGMDENDWEGLETPDRKSIGDRVQLVGDDLVCNQRHPT